MTPDQKKDAHLEGKILKELSHPNIIHFREVLTDKDYLYIVMDYADGGDLSMKIREQEGKFFDENKILDWFTQVCLAIKHIHDRKILHRDIKSQNIFLMKNGQIKLGDFGIAKCLNQTIDKAKTYVGTPYYLSPEIINSQPYDFKSDIWSLGVLLYEMCALKMPFDASNLPQLYIKIINCNYQPLSNNYSDELKKLVKAMLNETSLKRPNIEQVLNYSIIKSRIRKFLNDEEYEAEFSHTILHKFNLNSSDEKPDKKNNKEKNLRISSGHTNDNIDINKRNNYHYYKKELDKGSNNNNYDFLRKNLEGKPNQININNNKNKNRQNMGNFINNNHNYNNNGFIRNKKGKMISKDNININSNNTDFNFVNGHRVIDNSAKFVPNSGSNQRKIEYSKRNSNNSNKIKIINTPANNININNSHNYNIKSNREKEQERKKEIDELKKKGKQNKNQNGEFVFWMKGMEKFDEKKGNEIIKKTNNQNNNVNNSNNKTTNITENDQRLCNDLILGKNSGKKEIKGKNLMFLNNINLNDLSKINKNNSNDFLIEQVIKEKNDLYEDMMKQNNNIIYNQPNNNEDSSYKRLKENLNFETDINIDNEIVTSNIFNDISSEFGTELSENISNIIKKYVNDDILTYDYSKITENIIKECKKNNINQNLIEKAINQIPDFYYLILCKRL